MRGDEMPAGDRFARAVEPYRRELLAHCYRMLGSVHDAEDLLQETWLRAWRSYDSYDPARASLRTWMYRIATNACLTAIESRRRRPLPAGLGGPSNPTTKPELNLEVPWLQPLPDALLDGETADPGAIVAVREGVRLAFVAALQHLSAQQRAVLVLRDVLSWRASEVAHLLETSTAAVNSALQRARSRIALASPAESDVREPTESVRRDLLDGYMAAFETTDVAALARLLKEDVALEMPPYLTWFAGRDDVSRFLASRFSIDPSPRRVVGTAANGQPAVAAYQRRADGTYHAHAIYVLTLAGDLVARITAFVDPGLFPTFDLPVEVTAQQA